MSRSRSGTLPAAPEQPAPQQQHVPSKTELTTTEQRQAKQTPVAAPASAPRSEDAGPASPSLCSSPTVIPVMLTVDEFCEPKETRPSFLSAEKVPVAYQKKMRM